MRVTRDLLLCSCLATWATLLAGSAWAQAEPIVVEYRAPSGCPSAREFQREVFERTKAARLATAGETARTFEVEITRSAAQYTGSLVVHQVDGATVARQVSGGQCREVALVLALATALAIDPRAELAPRQTLESTPGAPDTPLAPGIDTGAERPSAADSDIPIVTAPPPSDSSRVNLTEPELGAPPALDPSYDAPAQPGPPAWQRRGFGLALGPRAALGVTPEPALGAGLWVGVLPHERSSLTWSLELAAHWTQKSNVNGAQARFEFVVARPAICPWDLPAEVLALSLCLASEWGVLEGEGSGLPFSATRQRVWGTLEPLARLDFALSKHWFAQFEAGAALPLTRYQFVFEGPETNIHRVPWLTATGGVRVGVRL